MCYVYYQIFDILYLCLIFIVNYMTYFIYIFGVLCFFLKGVCICCHERHYSLVGFVRGGFDLLGFDMGGCFPCFGSSNKEGSGGVRVKEVPNRDSSFKEAAASVVPQSHHPSRVNSGLPPNFGIFLSQTSHALFDWMMASLAWFQLSSIPPFLYFFLVFLAMFFNPSCWLL